MQISRDDSPRGSSLLVIAAEASSCMYAKAFLRLWQKEYSHDSIYGVGDHEMATQLGMECFGFAEDMAVVGLQEVLKHIRPIKKTYNDILERARESKPRFALLLDYPGFNLRLAADLRKLNIPVVYYISPQVWAWKKGRVHQISRDVTDMLVVFPFEVEFYKKYGVEATFVGHPLVEVVQSEMKQSRSKVTSLPPLVEKNSKSPVGPQWVLGLMPGSRKSEILHNLKVQVQAAILFQKKNPKVEIRLLCAPTLNRDWLFEQLGEQAREWRIVQGAPTEMISNCNLILTASGTATLQVALCKKPMVVMYRMNPLTAMVARRIVRDVSFFCIVNLIAGREVVPEFFQNEANPLKLSEALNELVQNLNVRKLQEKNLEDVTLRLGGGGATQNVFNFLNNKYGKV